MATIVLSAAGAAIGGSIGGSLAGLSTAVIGRAVGATIGKVIDQRLMGQGADAVETGRVDRFRLTNASEGQPIAQLYGRMRLGGQVIWASDFKETSRTSGGGKGAPSQPKTTEFSYSVSLAVAVCEGCITRIGRVWADGEEVALADLNARIYRGDPDQLPDPAIEAIEGAGNVPAYRGTAYVVIENLPLARFGNRVPQFSFEVSRPGDQGDAGLQIDPHRAVSGVALMPGTGEYALASSPVFYSEGPGHKRSVNMNSPSGKSDLVTSVEALRDDLPNCQATSLVVSWFGNDLRCGECSVMPKVERSIGDAENMPWQVAGLNRASAQHVPLLEGRPIYGGTPTDASVIEAIRLLKSQNQNVMFYPFILMDQMADNSLPDPWNIAQTQPALPWRGRITTSIAPGEANSTDGTAAAVAEVAAFFGTASAADFSVGSGSVSYSGPNEWGFRRFILHNAALCAAAGGVASFCLGSEMRGLTQIRGDDGSFVAVTQLRALAVEVRAILGAETKIGYAADWSEYFGYQPQDGSNDRYFHLDPLWADPEINFVGIDNYMPLSDWRDEDDHADQAWQTIYDLEYLKANIEGGEGYDWFYQSQADRDAQIRTPIDDVAHNEAWIWRYKDIRNWWQMPHHERIDGVRQSTPTAWLPESKPIWFTEYGCAAVDKGTNEPNKFVDAKSSESALPAYSDGARDDLIQMQYLQAMLGYWGDDAKNPTSSIYGGKMIDMQNAYLWAWDARPYPHFPNNRALWSDGENYTRGHWANGRMSARTLASVVAEICEKSGLTSYDTSKLYGYVRGYTVDDVSDARSALQPLMLRFAFDAVERNGVLQFVMREGSSAIDVDAATLVETSEVEGAIEHLREAEQEMAGRVRLRFVQADADFETLAEEAILPDEATHSVSTSEIPLSLTRAEGRQVVERWLTEARVARETAKFALPPSQLSVGAGDVVRLPTEGDGEAALFRIDRVEQGAMQLVEAVRIEPKVYKPAKFSDDPVAIKPFASVAPVLPLFMDLPLITGEETAHAPYLAVSGDPWPGSVAAYSSTTDSAYSLNTLIDARAVVGLSENPMLAARPGVWDHGEGLQIKLTSGTLQSLADQSVLSGGNLAAIGDGTPGNWEVFQFRDAELIAADTYILRTRLRGQLGTDGLMPAVWPAGSWFVLLDGAPEQVDLSSNLRGVQQHFRIGPASKGYDDPSYEYVQSVFDGNGLRPYAPCHVAVQSAPAGDVDISWVRRTRIDGDGWETPEIPLGEETESYLVRLSQGGIAFREAVVSEPAWTYTAAQRTEDARTGPCQISVCQISARYGVGLAAIKDVTL